MATCLRWDAVSEGVTETSPAPVKDQLLYDRPLNRLPREIIVRIFRHFDPVCDSLPLLACVCKKWRKVLQETPSLWRKVHVRQTKHDSSSQYAVLGAIFITYGHHVQQLLWEPAMRISESVFYLIPSLSGLTVLSIPITWTRTLVETLSPLSQLTDVFINGGFDLSDEDLLLVAVQFPLLKRVTVSSCWAITWLGLQQFMICLEGLEDCSLKINNSLPVEDARSDRAMTEGSILIRSLNELTKFDVMTSLTLNLVPVEVEELWGAVVSLPNLKKLTVCNCEVGNLYGIMYIYLSFFSVSVLLSCSSSCQGSMTGSTLQ